jgi:hypothetical protein
VALVLLSLSLSGERVGLAGESSCENINSSSVSCRVEFFDVSILFGIWKMVFEYALWELFPLAVKDVCPAHPFSGKVKASNSGKE